MTVETTWPLALLGLIPYLWWVARNTLTDFNRKQLQLSLAVRSAIVVLLAVALMQPVVYREGSWMSVVYALDVSQSVSPPAIESAIRWISESDALGAASHSRFLAFAANSGLLEDPKQLKSVRVSNRPSEGSIDQSATNIEDALERALRSFAPNHLKRLVLITDGNENLGNFTRILGRMKRERVRVYTIPMPVRTTGDTWIESIMAPAQVTADELFALEVHVYSQSDTQGNVELKQEGKTLGSREVRLKKGLNRIAFERRMSETGPVTVEAEVRADGDRFAANNRFRESIVVRGRPRVLYVEGHPESARYLQQALQTEGLAVESTQATAIPEDLAVLDRYDAVILSDVPRESLTERQMKVIAVYVGELGGGFIMAGGEGNYGAGGYSNTPIEEILPVKFTLKKKREEMSLALVIVLDKSGSMGGQKIELAKEASKAAVDALTEAQHIGVIAFDYNFHWAVRLQTASNKAQIKANISTITAGGETNIYPALREAYIQLFATPAEVKHVILLSDGRSLPDDYQTLVNKMAASKMTVSTVAVGSGADRDLLTNIANWGQGRTYYIEDANQVPQIFLKETQIASRSSLIEEPFRPLVKKTAEVFKGIDFALAPPLLGYVNTQPKRTSEILLESKEGDPILSRWQYGLGKSVAFASDVKNRWAVEWLNWAGYGKFWAQLVRETMRRQDDGELDFRVRRDGNEARILINAVQKDGQFRNGLRPQIRVIAPNQAASVIDVNQAGPGSYRATFPLNQKGSYLFRAVGDETSSISRILTDSYPAEYHFYPPNIDALHSISDRTGGKFQPTAKDIFASDGETIARPTALWPYLAAVALILYLMDILLRRIRLFEEEYEGSVMK